MPRFRLRYQNHDLEMPPGDFVVGRSRDCQLALDDPLVSRRHAAFHATAEKIWVEDLGSRNGIKVNQNRVTGRVDLTHGDIVSIGNSDIVVQITSETAEHPMRKPAVTMTNEVADGA